MTLHGDCLDKLKELPDNSVDAIVTDPPYGWRFMGKAWDGADIEKFAKKKERGGMMADGKSRKPRDLPAESAGTYDQSLTGNQAFQEFTRAWALEAIRVLKPGGHLLCFCGPRTYHRMAAGVEDAGFEIRDQLQWIFGSGFPKSHNIKEGDFKGWGTALKPANEPICLARKPLEGTVAANVLKYGTGAINVDASRIGTEKIRVTHHVGNSHSQSYKEQGKTATLGEYTEHQGRWPANVLFDEEAARLLDEQSGSLSRQGSKKLKDCPSDMFAGGSKDSTFYGDSGGASRFFYVAKASKRERNEGLDGMPLKDPPGSKRSTPAEGRTSALGAPRANHHPTVKPIKLMEYLIKMITPPNGTVLDPFMGSGSTGVAAKRLGFNFIGIEREKEYVEISNKRIEAVA